MRNNLLTFAGAACALSLSSGALAKTVTVAMKNRGDSGVMVFEPAFVEIRPGDTVLFRATDTAHDAVSIPSMLPPGARPFRGEMNRDVSVVFTQEGVYGIKCTPHFGMGMVALVKVGRATSNLAAATNATNSLPPLAKRRMTALLTLANTAR